MWFVCFFFFNDTATTEIYTLSLHDALPIFSRESRGLVDQRVVPAPRSTHQAHAGRLGNRPRPALDDGEHPGDRKSTRLNSSHANISYAVFCLKKKIENIQPPIICNSPHMYT